MDKPDSSFSAHLGGKGLFRYFRPRLGLHLLPKRCRFCFFFFFFLLFFRLEYSYSSVDIVHNLIKSLFLQSLKFSLFLFIYSLLYLKALNCMRLIWLNTEFSVISVSRKLFVRQLLGCK